MPVAAMLSGAVHQPVDLALGEVAPLDCQAYDAWGAFLGCRFHADRPCLRLQTVKLFLAQSNRDAERPTGSARATLPETCCGDDGRPSNDRQLHWPNAGFSTWSSSSVRGSGPAQCRRISKKRA